MSFPRAGNGRFIPLPLAILFAAIFFCANAMACLGTVLN